MSLIFDPNNRGMCTDCGPLTTGRAWLAWALPKALALVLLLAGSRYAEAQNAAADPARPRFSSPREDGRFVSSGGLVHRMLKRDRPKLAFDPTLSADQFAAWQTAVREKLRELMHFPEMADQPPPRQLSSEPRDGYRLEKWEAYPEPDSVVPFLVLIPSQADASAPLPAALCLPGSAHSKESLAGEPELPGVVDRGHSPHDQMALWYVKAGLVAVAMDNPGIAETSDPKIDSDEFAQYLMWLGRSYESLAVFQKLPVLAWLKQQKVVDPRRIAVSGHSLGAKYALHLALIDPQIAAVVWNDAVVSWRERAVVQNLRAPFVNRQFLPGMLEWFDYPDLMAALAPRPLLIGEGGRTRDLDRLKKAFALADAADHLQVAYYPRYAAPENRKLEDRDIPEGLSTDEYLPYVNVDPPNHWFKNDVAVPWLTRMLKLK